MRELRLTTSQVIELKLECLKMAIDFCGSGNFDYTKKVAKEFYEFIIKDGEL